jgi:transcriptional regulator with XRE-family HTH domain
MTLGQRIKMARERLEPKVSQRKLGDALDVSDKAVSAWERDIDRPEHDKLPKLRRFLRVTFAWLIAGEGEPPAPGDPIVLWDDHLDGLWEATRAKNRAARSRKPQAG